MVLPIVTLLPIFNVSPNDNALSTASICKLVELSPVNKLPSPKNRVAEISPLMRTLLPTCKLLFTDTSFTYNVSSRVVASFTCKVLSNVVELLTLNGLYMVTAPPVPGSTSNTPPILKN